MDMNILNPNVSVNKYPTYYSLSHTNGSKESVELYLKYRLAEMVTIDSYRNIAMFVGIIIVLVNSSVVVSSGLILKKGFPLQRKFLKKCAVPSIFSWNVGDSQQQTSRALRLQERNTRRSLNYSLNSSTENQADCSSSGPSEPNEELIVYQDLHDIGFEVEVISDPSSDSKENVETVQHQHINQGTQTTFALRLFSKDDLLSDNDSVHYYTGLESYDKFKLVLSTLCPMANDLKYKGSQVISLSIEDQFLILLIKLRRNKPDFELSKYFGVSKTTISNVFVTWLNFTYDLWSLIDIWPSRDLVDYNMPLQFKKYHSKTRVIIDGTEIPITKPKNPTAQQATFSTYKNKNKMKFLVVATPGGLISYCSEGYGGSTSDRQIIERSDLFEKCDSGDSIMADRGFNVQDLFASKDIGVNISTFLRGQQAKSTYLLLGNVSLADAIVGMSMIITSIGKKSIASSSMCVFKIGMLTGPAFVSIFTVVLIVIDRYFYILHGLYYHRYFTSTKVRISIVITWVIGLSLGFIPVTGWINEEYKDASCSFITLFPDNLIIFNSFLCIIALSLILILYAIILVHALRNVSEINASKKIVSTKTGSLPNTNSTTLGIHRGKSADVIPKNNLTDLKRSASFSECRCKKWTYMFNKSKSIHDLSNNNETFTEKQNIQKSMAQRCSTAESDFSITSIDLSCSDQNTSVSSVDVSKKIKPGTLKNNVEKLKRKSREPSKLRAIIVVLLSSCSIIIAWLPFFITAIVYVLCENKRTNMKCLKVRMLLGPLVILAFLNSILNPLIYAWWHKGFQRTIKAYYQRFMYNLRFRNS